MLQLSDSNASWHCTIDPFMVITGLFTVASLRSAQSNSWHKCDCFGAVWTQQSYLGAHQKQEHLFGGVLLWLTVNAIQLKWTASLHDVEQHTAHETLTSSAFKRCHLARLSLLHIWPEMTVTIMRKCKFWGSILNNGTRKQTLLSPPAKTKTGNSSHVAFCR